MSYYCFANCHDSYIKFMFYLYFQSSIVAFKNRTMKKRAEREKKRIKFKV